MEWNRAGGGTEECWMGVKRSFHFRQLEKVSLRRWHLNKSWMGIGDRAKSEEIAPSTRNSTCKGPGADSASSHTVWVRWAAGGGLLWGGQGIISKSDRSLGLLGLAHKAPKLGKDYIGRFLTSQVQDSRSVDCDCSIRNCTSSDHG